MRPSRFTPMVMALALGCAPPPATPRPSAGPEHGAGVKPAVPERKVVEIAAPAPGGGRAVTAARYETVYLDPVIEELGERDRRRKKKQAEATSLVRDRQEEESEKERKEELVLRSSLPADQRPASPDVFKTVPHQPPQAQYLTGTCWSFGTTSFLEAESERITGRGIKLSEMASVYWEYQAKAERFVAERGKSLFAEGSEPASVMRMWKEHGAWPLEAFAGVMPEDPRHDHQRLVSEMEAVLDSVKASDLWDSDTVLAMIRVIEDREMGSPPATFAFEGKTMTPIEFMSDVVGIVPDDYVQFISTLEMDFYKRGEFKVPDNWWHDDSYHNVPLHEFYGAMRSAIEAGYSLAVAVDVSEPGKDAENDVMFIPEYDIPGDRIDQLAREYRFAHEVTTDDHAVHIVGLAEHAGHDWFLVKDSGRSARHGKIEGYYLMRDDYAKLKVLSFTVHRDAVKDLLAKF